MVDALEDIGFFCVDNIPPKLILKFAELCSQSAQAMDRVAIVVDARSREMFSTFSESLAELTARGYTYKILYIEAEDSVILKRYKETRRRHPLLDGECDSTEEALKSERELLRFARENADYILDTSLLLHCPVEGKDRRPVFERHQPKAFGERHVLWVQVRPPRGGGFGV